MCETNLDSIPNACKYKQQYNEKTVANVDLEFLEELLLALVNNGEFDLAFEFVLQLEKHYLGSHETELRAACWPVHFAAMLLWLYGVSETSKVRFVFAFFSLIAV